MNAAEVEIVGSRDIAVLDEARQKVADRLIERLGIARTTDVSSHVWPAQSGATVLESEGWHPSSDLVMFLLTNPDSALVAAQAQYDPDLLEGP